MNEQSSIDRADLKSDLLKGLRVVSERMDQVGIAPSDIMDALGKGCDAWSLHGIYFRVQHFILHFSGSVGGVLFPVMGVIMVASVIKNATATVLSKIKVAVTALAALASVSSNPVTGLLKLFGLGAGTMDNDGTATDGSDGLGADAMIYALGSMVPPPVGLLVNTLTSSMGSMMIPNFTALATPTAAPAAARPATAPTVASTTLAPVTTAPAGTPPATAAPATTPPSSTGAIISTVASLGSDLLGALGLTDAEVRDAEVRDENTAGLIAKAAISMGLDPNEIYARAREIASGTNVDIR